MRSERSNKRDPAKVRREILDAPVLRVPVVVPPQAPIYVPQPANTLNEWELLPPLDEIIDSVNCFTRHYFQLGFIHKQSFVERLRVSPQSISVFFLLSLLSVSARLTPSLIARHEGGVKAAELYMERASSVALNELYRSPTLERCQSFYLLSIAQQGSGMKNKSSINMSIAVRIGTLLQLHREETYTLTDPPLELIVEAESARRTLVSWPRSWLLLRRSTVSGPLGLTPVR